jgi:hypothetical protein
MFTGPTADTTALASMTTPQSQHSGLVFTTELGRPVDPRNLLRVIEVAAEAAGVEHVGLHTLRHSAAVAWLAPPSRPLQPRRPHGPAWRAGLVTHRRPRVLGRGRPARGP